MGQYATEAEAQAYMDERLNVEPWTSASSGDRDKALMMATKIIDRLNFLGKKASDAQELQFPRADDTVVPQDVKNATSEIALALLDDVDPEMEFENLGMISQTYDNIKSTYDRSRPSEHILAGVPSMAAWRFLKPFLRDPQEIDLSRVS